MSKNNFHIVVLTFLFGFFTANAQTMAQTMGQPMALDSILSAIRKNNPQVKMFEADILSMDAAAKGAKSWMPPQISTGFFMTPYNTEMWKANDMSMGMGSYMLGATQMFPNSRKLNADYKYMSAMSTVETENKNYTLNQLNALAKKNYYQWLIADKKIKIASDNLLLLDYMIKSMEIRYQYNMDKLPSYYKAKSLRGTSENMISMLLSDTHQRRLILNSLMFRDKTTHFEIDSVYKIKDFKLEASDTTVLAQNRSDLKALDKSIILNQLKTESEKSKLLPDFGLKYDHMFTFGNQPDMFSLMLMVNIPIAPWSSKMTKANEESLRFQNESLKWQKQMVLNEATEMLAHMTYELDTAKKQYEVAQKSIIPALKKNYDTAVLAWQNNTSDLFVVLDAWEALNMAQLNALDKLQDIMNIQVEIEKQLEIK